MRTLPVTLSDQQARILKLIIEADGYILLREIAEKLQVHLGSVSRPLKYMEEKGYIVKAKTKEGTRRLGRIETTEIARNWYKRNYGDITPNN